MGTGALIIVNMLFLYANRHCLGIQVGIGALSSKYITLDRREEIQVGIGALSSKYNTLDRREEIQVGIGALSSKYNTLEREGERYRWE